MRSYIALSPFGQGKRSWKDLPSEVHLRTSELLTLVDACNLGLTSKYHLGLYAEVHSHRLRVLLTKEFDLPVNHLISKMRHLNGIIVGAFTLAVVDPEVSTPYEIDFILPYGTFNEFVKFILARTSYRPITHQMVPLYSLDEDSGVRRIKEFRNTRARVLRIMEAELSTATSAIFLFPSTAAMNYITWNSIVCPYPHMLIDRVALLNTFRASSPFPIQRFIAKYSRLGYSTYRNASLTYYGHYCHINPYCAQTPRRIDDGNSMVIRWNTYQSPTDLVDSKLEWRLAFRYQCSGATLPTGATVAPSNGECIVVRVRIIHNHNNVEAMTLIRTNRRED
ncbi:hypothetical protein NMY22_g17238 [Coprinellus aureogranulatus]|nr:hypothetical protein NMY22_g17238 [Coprinellus aureogranulatus]